jgi:hypothetical protein
LKRMRHFIPSYPFLNGTANIKRVPGLVRVLVARRLAP